MCSIEACTAFQITLSPEGLQHLHRKPPDEPKAQPNKVVLLDELIQIDAEQLKGDAQVAAEHEVLLYVDHIVAVLWVLAPQMLQDFQLHLGLVVEALLVPDDLQSFKVTSLVIQHLEHLAKAALAQH